MPKFQKEIEKLVMEKTLWANNVKTATGNRYLFNEPFLWFSAITFPSLQFSIRYLSSWDTSKLK